MMPAESHRPEQEERSPACHSILRSAAPARWSRQRVVGQDRFVGWVARPESSKGVLYPASSARPESSKGVPPCNTPWTIHLYPPPPSLLRSDFGKRHASTAEQGNSLEGAGEGELRGQTEPVLQDRCIDLPEVEVDAQVAVPGVEVEQVRRGADESSLDRRSGKENGPRGAVIGARRAVLFHRPAKLA